MAISRNKKPIPPGEEGTGSEVEPKRAEETPPAVKAMLLAGLGILLLCVPPAFVSFWARSYEPPVVADTKITDAHVSDVVTQVSSKVESDSKKENRQNVWYDLSGRVGEAFLIAAIGGYFFDVVIHRRTIMGTMKRMEKNLDSTLGQYTKNVEQTLNRYTTSERAKELGLDDISVRSKEEWFKSAAEAIKSTKTPIKIVGHGLGDFFKNGPLSQAILKSDKEVWALFAEPASEGMLTRGFYVDKIRTGGNTSAKEQYLNRRCGAELLSGISASSHLRMTDPEFGKRLTTRTYYGGPTCFMLITDTKLFMDPFVLSEGHDWRNGLMFEIQSGTVMYEFYKMHFETLWQNYWREFDDEAAAASIRTDVDAFMEASGNALINDFTAKLQARGRPSGGKDA